MVGGFEAARRAGKPVRDVGVALRHPPPYRRRRSRSGDQRICYKTNKKWKNKNKKIKNPGKNSLLIILKNGGLGGGEKKKKSLFCASGRPTARRGVLFYGGGSRKHRPNCRPAIVTGDILVSLSRGARRDETTVSRMAFVDDCRDSFPHRRIPSNLPYRRTACFPRHVNHSVVVGRGPPVAGSAHRLGAVAAVAAQRS